MINFTSKLDKINQSTEYFYQTLPLIVSALNDLPENKYFTYCQETNLQVAKKIKLMLIDDKIVLGGFEVDSQLEINVVGYKTFNPWSKVIGYTTKKSNTIHVNLRKIPSMSKEEIAGHLFHELLHIIGYGHGNNYYSDKKKYSVNYFLGYLMSGEVELDDLLDHKYL